MTTNRKFNRKFLAALGLIGLMALSGCWNDKDDEDVVVLPPPGPPPVVVNEVPDSAGVSVAAFISYLLALAGNDETGQPATLKDSFAVPADETSEPSAVT